MEANPFTRAMALVPSPVTVVTTVDATGRRWGFTASSFSSVSLDPPLILVCLDKNSTGYAAFTSAQRFLINVLSHEQAGVARRFAQRGGDKFAAGDMTPCELDLPGHPDASCRVACSLHCVVDAGDHSILVGRVEQTHVSDRTPLVYCNRSFAYPALTRNSA